MDGHPDPGISGHIGSFKISASRASSGTIQQIGSKKPNIKPMKVADLVFPVMELLPFGLKDLGALLDYEQPQGSVRFFHQHDTVPR